MWPTFSTLLWTLFLYGCKTRNQNDFFFAVFSALVSRELVKVPFVSQQNSFGHCAPSDLIWSLNKFQPLWPSLLPPLFHCDKSLFVLCANSSWGIAPQVAPPWCLLTAAVPDRIGTGGISLRIISQDLVWPFVCCDWICIFFSCCFILFSLLFHTFTFNQLNYFDFWLEFRNYCGLGWNKPPSSVTRLIESDTFWFKVSTRSAGLALIQCCGGMSRDHDRPLGHKGNIFFFVLNLIIGHFSKSSKTLLLLFLIL